MDRFIWRQGRLAVSCAHGNKYLWPIVSRISWEAKQLHYQKGLCSIDTLRDTWAQFSRRMILSSHLNAESGQFDRWQIWQVFVVPLSPSCRMAGHCLKLGLCRLLPRPTICRYIDIIQLLTKGWSCQMSSSKTDKHGKRICSSIETVTQTDMCRQTICTPTYWRRSSINHKKNK